MCRAISLRGKAVSGVVPFNRMLPAAGRKMPLSRRRTVVLPDPLGPMIPVIDAGPQFQGEVAHHGISIGKAHIACFQFRR